MTLLNYVTCYSVGEVRGIVASNVIITVIR